MLLVRHVAKVYGLTSGTETWILTAVPAVASVFTGLISLVSRSALIKVLRYAWAMDRDSAVVECTEVLGRLDAAITTTTDEGVLAKARIERSRVEERRLTVATAMFPERPWSGDE